MENGLFEGAQLLSLPMGLRDESYIGYISAGRITLLPDYTRHGFCCFYDLSGAISEFMEYRGGKREGFYLRFDPQMGPDVKYKIISKRGVELTLERRGRRFSYEAVGPDHKKHGVEVWINGELYLVFDCRKCAATISLIYVETGYTGIREFRYYEADRLLGRWLWS